MNQTAPRLLPAETLPHVHGAAGLLQKTRAGTSIADLGAALHARATANEGDAAALLDLSTFLYMKKDDELARTVQKLALDSGRAFRFDATAGEKGIRVLALMVEGDLAANTPLDYLVLDSDVRLDWLYVKADLPFPRGVPDHDVLFVAVGEADEHRPLLRRLDAWLRNWPRPVVNEPGQILGVAREQAFRLLSDAPGVVMPSTVRVGTPCLLGVARASVPPAEALPACDFPLIVRPVGSHMGRGLAKADSVRALREYLRSHTGGEFYVSSFVDYRGEDGLFRKIRLVLIEGRAFACHLAVSSEWMVHYQTAPMAEDQARRDEEARFMATFDDVFAVRHAAALEAIFERMDLDYLVVDCAELADGRLLVFEVDSDALVHDFDPEELFPYKKPVMRKAFDAFRLMLEHVRAAAEAQAFALPAAATG